MTWIRTIAPADADGKLKTLYDRIAGTGGQVDNILKAHALRPHTLEGHMALYKSVLHHFGNSLDKWILEAVGVTVSQINGCSYCVQHHYTGMKRLLQDDARAEAIKAAIVADAPEQALEGKALAALRYAAKLTRAPAAMLEADIAALRAVGLEDGEILEINQVAGYFAYANRTILGLGVTTAGEDIGLAPSDSDTPDDWGHQ